LSTSDIKEFESKVKEYLEEIKKIHDCPDLDFKIEENNSSLQAVSN
jgi:hypothetical protein